MAKIDSLIVKQAVRDVASKNQKLSKQAVLYFHSKDFLDLCSRNRIDSNAINRSIKELVSFPMISKEPPFVILNMMKLKRSYYLINIWLLALMKILNLKKIIIL